MASPQNKKPAQIVEQCSSHRVPLNPSADPNFEPKRQYFGYFATIVGLIAMIGYLQDSIKLYTNSNGQNEQIQYGIFAFGGLFYLLFLLKALYSPSYIGGNPTFLSFWPLFLGGIIRLGVLITFYLLKFHISNFSSLLIIDSVILVGSLLVYLRNDEPAAYFRCFKPWVYRRRKPESELRNFSNV